MLLTHISGNNHRFSCVRLGALLLVPNFWVWGRRLGSNQSRVIHLKNHFTSIFVSQMNRKVLYKAENTKYCLVYKTYIKVHYSAPFDQLRTVLIKTRD